MNRSTTLFLIAIALAGYGIYAASYVPALAGSPELALLVCFILQAVCALAGAIGVWRRMRWAAGVVVLLGVSVAGTWLFEAFVLGMVAYLHALLISVIALVTTLVIAAYLNRQVAIGRT